MTNVKFQMTNEFLMTNAKLSNLAFGFNLDFVIGHLTL